MERDFAVRFTNENYASKDEVRRHLNISSIDSIWERVVNYRSYFKKTLELSSIEFKAFSVCLTLPLQQRVFSLEKRLIKNMIFLSKLDYESEKVFINYITKETKKYKPIHNLEYFLDIACKPHMQTRAIQK